MGQLLKWTYISGKILYLTTLAKTQNLEITAKIHHDGMSRKFRTEVLSIQYRGMALLKRKQAKFSPC